MYRVKYSQQQVSAVIDRLASQLEIHENTVFLVLMNGGAWFAHELIARFPDIPVRIEYAKLSSYHDNRRGELLITYMPEVDWKGKEVIVLDDICDSGNTLNCVYTWLMQREPEAVRVITLLSRKGHYQLVDGLNLTSGIEDDSEDYFVGCGLDDNDKARNLPYVGVV